MNLKLESIRSWLKQAGADHYEIQAVQKDERILRFANNAVFQATDRKSTTFNIRTWANGGMAEIRAKTEEGEILQSLLERCVDRARSTAKAGLPATPEPQLSQADEQLIDFCDASLEPSSIGAGFEEAFSLAKSNAVELAGRANQGKRTVTVCNSLGLLRRYQVSETEAHIIAVDRKDDHISGYASAVGRKRDSVHISTLADTATEKCIRSRVQADIPTGEYDVILEPTAIAEIFEWLSAIAFTSKSLKERSSFFKDRIGQRVSSEKLTVTDDALGQRDEGIPEPFDVEGTTKQKVVILDEGIARGVVWDRKSADEAGCHSTGHATSGDLDFSSGPTTNHLCIGSGDEQIQSLLSRVDRGLWVTRFHYVNGLLDPPRAVMTGLTRDGTFLIEKGQIGPAVGMLRFTDSIVSALERIDGISKLRQAVRMGWSDGGICLAPTILIRGLKFTGNAKG